MMDINKICPGCMKQVENRDIVGTCPYCGYNIMNPALEPHQMRPFTILAGKYMVGRVIGEGGFGISYLGYDLNLELAVAIKEFYPSGFVTREANVTAMVTMYAGKNEMDVVRWRDGFINEARKLAKFSNLSGIVEVRDFFSENGTAYIVMEYIDGITLKEHLAQCGGRIPTDQTLTMMEPVIKSLSKVHDEGIIHRDISPDNIMITKYGGMKLLDFGAAREYAGNAEKSLSIMLKPGYAPEEQYRSRGNQGPWSDVYALSATIYKCITGITPVESMERMRTDSLMMPKEMGVDITDVQNEALRMGMAVYAESRLQSMDELHEALYAGFVPVSGLGSGPEPGQRPSNKKIAIIAAAAGGGLLFLVMVITIIASIAGRPKSTVSDNSDEIASASSVEEETEKGGGLSALFVSVEDEVNSLMDGGEYEEAIDKIIKFDTEDPDLLQKAVDGFYEQRKQESQNMIYNEGKYEEAFNLIDETVQYLDKVADKADYLKDKHEGDLGQHKYDMILVYKNNVYAAAQNFANNRDEEGMIRELDKLKGYVPDTELDKKREQHYTNIVMLNLNTMDGTNNDHRRYVLDYLEKTGYNGLVMECWYNYGAVEGYVMNGAREGIARIRKNAAGYILPQSNSSELTYGDINGLTEYELYFALYEIYARHGRSFSDPTMTKYFQSLGWYSEQVPREKFDEGTLSDIERKNIEVIVNYQQSAGYMKL